MNAPDPKIDCLKCQHYYVTWDPHFPKGCRLYKFKSSRTPSIVVYESTGAVCEYFSAKAGTKARPARG